MRENTRDQGVLRDRSLLIHMNLNNRCQFSNPVYTFFFRCWKERGRGGFNCFSHFD